MDESPHEPTPSAARPHAPAPDATFDGTRLYGGMREDADARPLGPGVTTYTKSNETGTGQVIGCQVFEGVQVFYNDMRMAYCSQSPTTAGHVIEINHCRSGRFECAFGENSLCYVGTGDLAISSAMRRKESSSFPLGQYQGITIVVCLDELDPDVRALMAFFDIDLAHLRDYICGANRCCLLRADPSVEAIFSDWYRSWPQQKPGHVRLRLLQVLQLADRLGDGAKAPSQQAEYFSRAQVGLAKNVADHITQDLARHESIGQLARRFEVSPTTLQRCFRGVFGSPVYAYLRAFRLETAQKLLLGTQLSVAEIAGEVGYENPSKFTTSFKEAFGMTPTDFRRSDGWPEPTAGYHFG